MLPDVISLFHSLSPMIESFNVHMFRRVGFEFSRAGCDSLQITRPRIEKTEYTRIQLELLRFGNNRFEGANMNRGA